jgi:hypothetical protein
MFAIEHSFDGLPVRSFSVPAAVGRRLHFLSGTTARPPAWLSPGAAKNAKTTMKRGVKTPEPARLCLRPPLLVVGEFEYLLDVAGASAEAVRHVERRDALVAPPQDAPFNGTQPVRRFRRGPSWEIREHEDTFDEVLTAIEPATDLCRHHAFSGKPADPSFEWSKVSGSAHHYAGYCDRSLCAAVPSRAARTVGPRRIRGRGR